MRFRVAERTDNGRVRDHNEDSRLIDLPLLAVADGMGGHRGGEVASETALDVLRAHKSRVADAPADMTAAFKEANATVFEKGQKDARLQGMGTTLTAGWLSDDKITIVHVGDSRAYLLRGGNLTQLTEDHTLVRELERKGELSADEAATSPQRNILLQAIGVDAGELEIDVTTVDLKPGDRLLLASDGLHSMITENDRIRDIMLANDDPDDACRALVDAANDAGGHDNITVVLLDALADDASAPASAPAPVVIEKPSTAASSVVPAPRRWYARRSVAVVLAIAAVAAIVAGFVLLRSAGTGYVVSARNGEVVVLSGRVGASGAPATGDVVQDLGVPLTSFALPVQRTITTGIAVDSVPDAQRVVSRLPRVLGPTQTPGPTPAATRSPSPRPLETASPTKQ